MRRLVAALVLAALAAAVPGAPVQAGEAEVYLVVSADQVPALLAGGLVSEDAVLTPEAVGLADPGQGFYPFFAGLGTGVPISALSGGATGTLPLGLGSIALGVTGSGIIGLGGLNGGGGCGIFGIGFCPFFQAAPFTSTFPGAGGTLGLSNQFLGGGLGLAGTGTLGLGNVRIIVLR